MSASSARPGRPPSGAATATTEVKHRACDECRTRKLACSKEPNGCARCRTEEIVCHYSAQKTMGRPRKRPRNVVEPVEVAAAPATAAQDANDNGVAIFQGDINFGAMDFDQSSLIDPSLAYDVNAPLSDSDFLDFLGIDFALHEPAVLGKPPPIDPTNWTAHLYDVNIDPNLPHHEPAESTTSLTPPSLSSQGASPASDPATPSSLQPATCACLAKLYLALDSTARLPTSTLPALHTARTAARTAHDALRCTVCCPPTTHQKLGAQAFQNMMLLGALIPSLAHAYHTILALVDAEAARAEAEQAQLTFSLSAYGGTWGGLGGKVCATTLEASASQDAFEAKVMAPAAWRLSVRTLLKMDVYGMSCGSGSQWQQIGLRELVAQMDEKSRVRHAEIDALVEAGLPPPVCLGIAAQHSLGREPQCRPIIRNAREAVESLHIA